MYHIRNSEAQLRFTFYYNKLYELNMQINTQFVFTHRVHIVMHLTLYKRFVCEHYTGKRYFLQKKQRRTENSNIVINKCINS